MSEFSIPVRVYIEDTDAGGIVYYVNYLKYMERVRTEWLRHLGFQHYTLAQEDYQFVVHSCEARYRSPARMDEQLTVSAAISKVGKAFILFHQEVRRALDNSLCCEAQIKVACINPITMKPARLPDNIRQAFEASEQ